jgi:hypothetical protein
LTFEIADYKHSLKRSTGENREFLEKNVKLQEQLTATQAEHANKITELKATHSQEMAKLKAKIEEMQAAHSQEMTELKKSNSEEMANLDGLCKQKTVELEAKIKEMIDASRSKRNLPRGTWGGAITE